MTTLHIVMPAYNEEEGIRSFIDEIRTHVADLADGVRFFIVDDRSTDSTPAVLRAAAADHGDITAIRSEVNQGHGPTALAAYRAGLADRPDIIVHVDGDGQFAGEDFRALLSALAEADVVHGVRRGRTDPWYRRTLTRSVQFLVRATSGAQVPDVNTPLRAYRPDALDALLAAVPADAMVPHVHFSLAEARSGFRVRHVDVRSLPRRGTSAEGTMWGTTKTPRLPPRRLRSFARGALGEVWRVSLSPKAPLRRGVPLAQAEQPAR